MSIIIGAFIFIALIFVLIHCILCHCPHINEEEFQADDDYPKRIRKHK